MEIRFVLCPGVLNTFVCGTLKFELFSRVGFFFLGDETSYQVQIGTFLDKLLSRGFILGCKYEWYFFTVYLTINVIIDSKIMTTTSNYLVNNDAMVYHEMVIILVNHHANSYLYSYFHAMTP